MMRWGIDKYDPSKLVRIPIKKACKGYYLRWYYNGWHYWFFLPGKISELTEGEKYRTIGTRKISMASGQITPGQIAGIKTIMNSREVALFTNAGWMNIRIDPGSIIVYDNQITGYEMDFVAIIGSKEISYTDGYSPVADIPFVPPLFSCCEVIIGTQIWMCKNWDIDYPGSKVYNNDESNRSKYGGLYDYNQVIAPGFCPVGWHVPTYDEWNTLITHLGGPTIAGEHLKEAGLLHWASPNDSNADNSSLFTSLPGGNFHFNLNDFFNLALGGYFWTATSAPPYDAWLSCMYFSNKEAALNSVRAYHYYSVRLIKDSPASPLIDYDGNIYTSIVIGEQEWIMQNLRTKHYADGTSIPIITNYAAWLADVTGARCEFDNDPALAAIYGQLYNWYAVNNVHNLAVGQFTQGGLLSAGWRIPALADVNNLSTYLGGGAIAGGKIKSTGYSLWAPPNLGATNETGFMALPGGERDDPFDFTSRGVCGDFWCSDVFGADAYMWYCQYDNTEIFTAWKDKLTGRSIRCVRDV